MNSKMFEMLYILINEEKTTAKSLASTFGVTTRTIYRYLDNLLVAGIPVITKKGNNGGIYLDGKYVMDKALFTDKEKDALVVSLKSVNYFNDNSKVIQKVGALFNNEPS